MKKEVLNEGPWLLACCCPVLTINTVNSERGRVWECE